MKRKYGAALLYMVCGLLTVAAFFAKDFVLYDFHMEASDYTFRLTDQARPDAAVPDVWFDYGDGGKEVLIGVSEEIDPEDVKMYTLTADGSIAVDMEESASFQSNLLSNYVIVALPERLKDIDGDGDPERIRDFARADIGEPAFNPTPQIFGHEDIPFELVFSERKYIRVFLYNQLLTEGEVSATSADGSSKIYPIDSRGWIDGLPIRDIREGFSAVYVSADDQTVYRMQYALEDYPLGGLHFRKAQIPLLLVCALAVIGIILIQTVRCKIGRGTPDYRIYSREQTGYYPKTPLLEKTGSRFLLIRWLCMLLGMFALTYLGKLTGQGQIGNEIAIPSFACPFNMDQIVEMPCYYLSHLPNLLLRGGEAFPMRTVRYIILFTVTLLLSFVFLGRILCGFLCPAGLLQDVMDQLRRALHIRPVTVTDRMYRILQPVKWLWIVLFLGAFFAGIDFCDICPLKVFNTAQGGFWTNLYLGGFLSVFILVGSFFIRRFWCLICPLGYLMGLFHKYNLFQLKKDCVACTECGGCYEACPMRLKNIYTERETQDIQTVDCLMCGECIDKCPETGALSLTFCGKKIYRSDRMTFLSRYQPMTGKKALADEEREADRDEKNK
ncbi:MAG: 4Fe-4S binding protein [Clostridiales bacterium]|nr:4Fe-4S binding protein [Clostridiales bacterium]